MASEARSEPKASEVADGRLLAGRPPAKAGEARSEPKASEGRVAARPFPPRESAAMGDAEFRMLSELLRRHCGLHFGVESRYVFEKRVLRRVRELELTSFAAYHLLLRNGSGREQELARLVDELTINETYFFRERAQLDALVAEILPELRAQRGGRPVGIWSAGCSSGEEPYSVVILAREAGFEPGVDFRVYASDISQRMLRRAREGVYRETSFRDTEPALRDHYFTPVEQGLRIAAEVKRHVDFIHLNLFDGSKLALLGTLDVILCRNVIIYFDAPGKRRVIDTFHDRLRPGGYLLLGHSESLINLASSFELHHLRRELVYRRPLGVRIGAAPWPVAGESGIGDADARELVR
jgi:chemotaxis protein methyltransferase CheR